VPAKKDPNLEKLELRLLFFSSLILPPSEKALESRFNHVAGSHHKQESRPQASGIASTSFRIPARSWSYSSGNLFQSATLLTNLSKAVGV
jgi:hypothetical protein